MFPCLCGPDAHVLFHSDVCRAEEEEWARARVERKRREGVEADKRRREEGRVGWGIEEARMDASGSGRAMAMAGTSSLSHGKGTDARRPSGARASSAATASRKRPSSTPTSSTKPMSPAVQALAGKLRLASALKADPFLQQARTRPRSVASGSGVAGRLSGKVEVRPAGGT